VLFSDPYVNVPALEDFTLFAGCTAGPDVTTPPLGCDPVVLAASDVDLRDSAGLQFAFGN
jgi:hypothetical protein